MKKGHSIYHKQHIWLRLISQNNTMNIKNEEDTTIAKKEVNKLLDWTQIELDKLGEIISKGKIIIENNFSDSFLYMFSWRL